MARVGSYPLRTSLRDTLPGNGSEAKADVKKWIDIYNNNRPHSALWGKPPAVVYSQRKNTTNPDQQVQKVA